MFNLNIDSFEGPLDLLLSLIQKNKLDICEISINQIADEFLDTVSKMKVKDVEMMSDFIYVSSKLIEIKSKHMLFINRQEDEEEELVLSLEEYAKYKDLSICIKRMYKKEFMYFEKIPSEIFIKEELDLSKLNLKSIINSLKTKEQESNIEVKFTKKQKSLNDKINYISDYINKKNFCYFHDIVQEDKKDEKVVSILGVLHLAKDNVINVNQEENFDVISIQRAR